MEFLPSDPITNPSAVGTDEITVDIARQYGKNQIPLYLRPMTPSNQAAVNAELERW